MYRRFVAKSTFGGREEGRKEHGERPPRKSEVRPSPKSLAREDRDSMPSSSKRLEIQRLQRLKCTKALMKNFFSYQSCTKKRFQVFTTQCCPSSSLKPDSPLPSYPKPPKRRSKETSDPQCSSCHKRKRERKEKFIKFEPRTAPIPHITPHALNPTQQPAAATDTKSRHTNNSP